jgi:hypothetical protein
MAWQRPLGYRANWNGPTADPHYQNVQDGLDAELLAIRKAAAWPGVLGGLTPSIVGMTVEIAAGWAWCGGKSARGTQAEPVSPAQYPYVLDCVYDFDGEASDTYFLYLDGAEADEEDALKIVTDAGFAAAHDPLAHLVLARVTWNGSDTLSALKDIRAFGTIPAPLTGYDSAALGADTIIWRWEVDAPCAIRRPVIALQNCGSGAGPTVITVKAGAPGSTAEIWGAPGDRFSIAHSATDGAQVVGVYPDQNIALDEGDCVEILTVGTPATSAAGCSVTIPRFYYDEIV